MLCVKKKFLEKLNKENLQEVHVQVTTMMAWEYLEEQLMKQKVILKTLIHQIMKNIHKRISSSSEEANDEFSGSSSSTDYDHLE